MDFNIYVKRMTSNYALLTNAQFENQSPKEPS